MQPLGSDTPMSQAALLQQQQQQNFQSLAPLEQIRLGQQLQQQAIQPANALKQPSYSGVCARTLMQYLAQQRRRPADNKIGYWKKFVAEYYSPGAKKRWCLSLYDRANNHARGDIPRAARFWDYSEDAWHCNICGSKSGRGFEASFEMLPRLNEIKFGSGVIDELLFLDMPHEFRYSSGIMELESGKAVQESVYKRLRVVSEGRLRITFTHELKILAWEFCAKRYEEFRPPRLIASQLVQVVRKCQSNIAEGGSDGASQQDVQANINMVLTAVQRLAKSLELQSLNELGFSERYSRCLQVSHAANSMKDLIDYSKEQKTGPIECLKSYPQHVIAKRQQAQKMQVIDQMIADAMGQSTDRNTLSRTVSLLPDEWLNRQNQQLGEGSLSGLTQAALPSYQNLLMRQNTLNSTSSNPLNQSTSSFHGTAASTSAPMQNLPGGALSSPRLAPNQSHFHQHPNINNFIGQNHLQNAHNSNNNNQAMHDQLSNNSVGGQPQPLAGSNTNTHGSRDRNYSGVGGSTDVINVSDSNMPAPSRTNSVTSASTGDVVTAAGDRSSSGFDQTSDDFLQDLHFDDDIFQDIGNDFPVNEFTDLDNIDWKD